MNNRFIGYLFMAIMTLLLATLFVSSLGMNKKIKEFDGIARQIAFKHKLSDCRIMPFKDENNKTALQLTWDKRFEEEVENDKVERDYVVEQECKRLALRLLCMSDPKPDYVYIKGRERKFILKSTHKAIQIEDFFNFSRNSE
jgi:hypothetical protein